MEELENRLKDVSKNATLVQTQGVLQSIGADIGTMVAETQANRTLRRAEIAAKDIIDQAKLKSDLAKKIAVATGDISKQSVKTMEERVRREKAGAAEGEKAKQKTEEETSLAGKIPLQNGTPSFQEAPKLSAPSTITSRERTDQTVREYQGAGTQFGTTFVPLTRTSSSDTTQTRDNVLTPAQVEQFRRADEQAELANKQTRAGNYLEAIKIAPRAGSAVHGKIADAMTRGDIGALSEALDGQEIAADKEYELKVRLLESQLATAQQAREVLRQRSNMDVAEFVLKFNGASTNALTGQGVGGGKAMTPAQLFKAQKDVIASGALDAENKNAGLYQDFTKNAISNGKYPVVVGDKWIGDGDTRVEFGDVGQLYRAMDVVAEGILPDGQAASQEDVVRSVQLIKSSGLVDVSNDRQVGPSPQAKGHNQNTALSLISGWMNQKAIRDSGGLVGGARAQIAVDDSGLFNLYLTSTEASPRVLQSLEETFSEFSAANTPPEKRKPTEFKSVGKRPFAVPGVGTAVDAAVEAGKGVVSRLPEVSVPTAEGVAESLKRAGWVGHRPGSR